jgi:thioredoxin reductase (NADPH)/alkyl hydroperoxide reductase subunit F
MRSEIDLLILGAGPAGCAAAVMAASVGLTAVIVDPAGRIGGTLHRIATISNVLGGHRTGHALASAIAEDVERAGAQVVTGTAISVEARDESVTVRLEDGRSLTAAHVVVATGVGLAQPVDAAWITAPPALRLPALWEADPSGAAGETWLVLGADRPLGTFLRAHPDADIRLLVPYPPADAYKAEEVAEDSRVELIRVDHLDVSRDLVAMPGNLHGGQVFSNIGVVPRSLPGLEQDGLGYCPADRQHPRLHIAGDLRSPHGQRVQTAMGTGAAAALDTYYADRRATT